MKPALSIALSTDSLESFLEKRKRVASPANDETPNALANTDKDIKFSSFIGVNFNLSLYLQLVVCTVSPRDPLSASPTPVETGDSQQLSRRRNFSRAVFAAPPFVSTTNLTTKPFLSEKHPCFSYKT
jgi:hypothetical protein